MSKFNKKINTKVINKAGGTAYAQSDKFKLASLLLTSFAGSQFYRTEKGTFKELKELIEKTSDKKFAAKAAVYARNEFGMRSISHVAAAEVARLVKGETWTKNFFNRVVHRPDDITEILSYYLNNYGKPYPNSLKKGLGLAFGKFDEYQLAKYRGEGNDVSLVDAVNYIHPIPSDKNKVALEKLINGTLKSSATWEAKLSEAGTEEEGREARKADAWRKLITSKKIGYFALLKNIRNILEQAPDVIEEAMKILKDEKMIKRSLVLPFRYATALEQVKNLSGVDTAAIRKALGGINRALDVSAQNVPELPGSTLVVLDESGSMGYETNAKDPISIGSLFAAILVKANNADYMGFSDTAQYRNLNPDDSTLSIRKEILDNRVNGGTNFNAIFSEANKKYDRIIILSDMQGWGGTPYYSFGAPTRSFDEYKKRYSANPFVYSFDLQGYGSLQFPETNVYQLAGFSEKVFDIMKLLEEDRQALVRKIESIEL